MSDDDMNRLHDVLVETNGRSYSELQLKAIFANLPVLIRNEIRTWGLDTALCDELYTHFKRHGVPAI